MLLPILGTLSLLGAVYFLMPLAIGVCHIGMFWPAALLLLAAAWCFFPGFFRRFPKWLKAVLLSGVGLVLAVALAVLTVMGLAAADRPSGDDAPETVVLLGCQVYNGRPSMMLQNRIEAAYEYLTAHPDAVCVTTGGRDNSNETVTEGGCAARELMAMGIARNGSTPRRSPLTRGRTCCSPRISSGRTGWTLMWLSPAIISTSTGASCLPVRRGWKPSPPDASVRGSSVPATPAARWWEFWPPGPESPK